ncbi:MAG: TonB-dependent receptor [Bacteroidales bacterium]|nr:TonB-dependent receptor [Bacteroidales bacterium]
MSAQAHSEPGVTETGHLPDPATRLEEVAVTGSRAPLQLGQSARIVTVLDSLAIQSLPVVTINDLLKYAVGVDVRQRGVEGMQTDVSIRGGSFDQIAILLNGVNISDPQTGHNAADFPVDITLIERIEILEGPASRVYGTSSLLGAINIITKNIHVVPEGEGGSLRPSARSCGSTGEVSAHLDGGSYLTLGGGVGTTLRTGDWHNSLSLSYRRSNGYTRSAAGTLNGDFQAVKAFYRGGYKELFWQAGMSLKDFGSNTFYSARFDDQFEHTFKTFAAIGADTQAGFLHLKPIIYWNHSQDRFELFRGKPEAYPFNHHRTNVLGANLGAWFETVAGRTAFGAEFRNEDIVSTNLGEPLSRPDGVYVVGLNRTQMAFYAEHNLTLRWFTASVGLTAARNTGSAEGFGIYPGADLSFRFLPDWKIYLNYNASYRVPTFTELYYSVGGHQADKKLKAEKMHAAEAGIKYLRPGMRAIISAWYHYGMDLIDWIKETPEAEWKSVNHTRLHAFGQEVTLRLDFPQLLGWSVWQNLQVAYSHIDQRKDLGAENIQSLYALNHLRHKLIVQTDIRLWSRLFLNLSCRWQDRVGTYERYEGLAPTGEFVPYTSCTFLDAQLSWNADNYRVYFQADNLLNKRWYDHGNIPQPGIWFRLGASYTFKWKK